MLPREELLAGAQNPEGLTVLVDLAEQAVSYTHLTLPTIGYV